MSLNKKIGKLFDYGNRIEKEFDKIISSGDMTRKSLLNTFNIDKPMHILLQNMLIEEEDIYGANNLATRLKIPVRFKHDPTEMDLFGDIMEDEVWDD